MVDLYPTVKHQRPIERSGTWIEIYPTRQTRVWSELLSFEGMRRWTTVLALLEITDVELTEC